MRTKLLKSLSFIFISVLALLTIVPIVSATTFTENFNSYTTGDYPCDPPTHTQPCTASNGVDYSETTGVDDTATYVSSSVSTKDYEFTPSVSGNNAEAVFNVHHDICHSFASPFFIKIAGISTDIPTGAWLTITGNDNSVAGPYTGSWNVYYLEFDNDGPFSTAGRVRLAYQTYEDGALAQVGFTNFLIYTPNYQPLTYYTFAISCSPGANAGQIDVNSIDAGTDEFTNVPTNNGANFRQEQYWTAYAGTNTGAPTQVYDDYSFDFVAASTALTPASTSSTMPNIQGFDITKDGTAAIVRYHPTAGYTGLVKVLDGDALIQTSPTIQTYCDRQNGVIGLGDQALAYIHCNISPTPDGVPDKVNFTNIIGNAPPTVDNCSSPGQACDGSFDIASNGQITVPDRTAISDMMPISQGTDHRSGSHSSINYYSIGMSESTGTNLLATDFLYRFTGTSNGEEHPTAVIADGSSLPDTCGFGNFKLFSAHTGSPVKGYTVTIDNSNGVNPNADPSITQTFTGTFGALLNGGFIDCAQDRIIVNSATRLTVWNYGTNAVVLDKSISGGSFNTISGTFGGMSFAAYSDGSVTHIFNAINGTEVAHINNPQALTDMEMDQCAQNLFLAGTSRTYRYDIAPKTTVTRISPTNGTCVVSSGITPGPTFSNTLSSTTLSDSFNPHDNNPLGLNVTYISSKLHVDRSATAIFLGLIIVVIMTIWLYRLTGSPIIAILGAGLGLVITIVIEFTKNWVIMAVILLLLLLLAKTFLGQGGEE